MIEAACTACGTINRVNEADLPAGARFLTCTSCKSRVGLPAIGVAPTLPMLDATIPRGPATTPPAVPPSGARPGPVPAPPTLPPSGAPRPGPAPSRTASLGEAARAPSARPSAPRVGAGEGPGRPSSSGIDLDFMPGESAFSGADLPAPKGALPPRAAAQPSKADITDLPAPKIRRTSYPDLQKGSTPPIADLPAPKPRPSQPPTRGAAPGGSVSRPPPRPLLDLPAPRSRGIGELPPSAIGGLGDLPAPKRTGPIEPPAAVGDLLPPPEPAASSLAELAVPRGIGDLPAPRPGIADVPAPRQRPPNLPAHRPSGAPDMSGLKHAAADALAARSAVAPDLPAPKAGGVPDLPAPKAGGVPDLPAPKAGGMPDLPAPKAGGMPDLPAPKAGGVSDLPAPRLADGPDLSGQGAPDLPAPRSGLADLPAPRPGGGSDLPAPKPGDPPDLPTPRDAAGLPAPRPGAPDLPAPKGFFDDLPQPAAGAFGPTALPAPKGFFDDLPGPAGRAAEPAAPGRDDHPQPAERAVASKELPAPKGFFEDLPGRPSARKPAPAEAPAPKGFFDDLPDRSTAGGPEPGAPGFFDDLPQPTRPPGGSEAMAEVPLQNVFDDLPQRLTPSRPVAIVDPPALGPGEDRPSRSSSRFDATAVQRPRPTPPRGAPAAEPSTTVTTRATPTARKSAPIAAEPRPAEGRTEPRPPTPVPAPKRPRSAPPDHAAARTRRTRMIRIGAIVAVALAALTAGGLFMYRRHAQEQARLASIEEHLTAARRAFEETDPKRWERAAAAARTVLALQPNHPAAVGLAAEALLADSIAYGINAAAKAQEARALLANAASAGVSGAEIARAQALAAGTSKHPDSSALEKLSEAAPRDHALVLYLGWSQAARGDAAAAAVSFTRVLGTEPLRVLALQGRAQAKLAQADLSGARDDFRTILQGDENHIAARVGLAAARPAAQAPQQEAELLAILARKDLAAGDPRAVLQAWVLAAEAARRAGKIEPARERYRKAQLLAPQDLSVIAGMAEIEILDGKLDAAAELAEKVLARDPDHVRAQLAAAEVAIRHKRVEDATTRLDLLRARKEPLATLERARLGLLSGKLLEAQGKDAAAVDAYVAAARLAGDLDLTPALTAVAKLGALAEAATEARDTGRAAVLRARADQIIAGLPGNAEEDPQLARAIGLTFLQSNDAGRAESWLRRAVDAQPRDAAARYQLAKALARLGHTDDAIAELERADQLEERRPEIGIELARMYELAGRADAAAGVFAKLLAVKDPPLEVLASAGRFYVRRGELAKAGALGEQIESADPTHPAGLYLRAEAALDAGKIDEAAKLFRAAVDGDRDPQYLDGQGRAAEAQAEQTGDLKFHDVALRAYIAATGSAPAMLNPLIGQGRIYVARRDASKAIPPLLAAAKIAPNHPAVARLIGLAYKELSERRVAAEWLARAYRLEPSAETAWNLGQLHNELNSPREAIAALTNATRLGLEQEKKDGAKVAWLTEALYRLGRIHMDRGNERAAKAAWEKYVARGPKAGAQLEEVRRELATTLQRY